MGKETTRLSFSTYEWKSLELRAHIMYYTNTKAQNILQEMRTKRRTVTHAYALVNCEVSFRVERNVRLSVPIHSTKKLFDVRKLR